MGIIGKVFGKSGGKSHATNDQLEADRARMATSATPGPLQTTEQIAHVREQMEAELDAQRARRAQSTTQQV